MNRPSSITSHPLSTPLLSGISPITEQRDRSRAAISWGKLLLGQWQSPLLFHHQRASIWKFLDERKGMGWCGCKVTGRENRTHTRGNENTLYTNSCHVCASWHPLNLIWSFHCTFSLFFTHTYKRSFTRSFFFFFFFVFKLSRAIDSMATRENSLELSQYRNNYSISIAKCFSMFCTNFCSLLFLC